jgi:hypothetical protein
MVDSALEPAERALLAALAELGVPFMIVGVTAAWMQGARVATDDIDLWFSRLDDPRLAEAARRAGGIWVGGHFGMQPPTFGGAIGDRFDVVLTMSGLGTFEQEYQGAKSLELDGLSVRVLPLQRQAPERVTQGDERAALPRDRLEISGPHRSQRWLHRR